MQHGVLLGTVNCTYMEFQVKKLKLNASGYAAYVSFFTSLVSEE
jgi:hypothetical protein